METRMSSIGEVLHALAAYDPETGYAQGMNFIAAAFLVLGFTEESAFWLLLSVLEDLLPQCHARDLGPYLQKRFLLEVASPTLEAAVIEKGSTQHYVLVITKR